MDPSKLVGPLIHNDYHNSSKNTKRTTTEVQQMIAANTKNRE